MRVFSLCCLSFLLVVSLCTTPGHAQHTGPFPVPVDEVRTGLKEIHAQVQGETGGHVASYIPALAKADPDHFGIALCAADGTLVSVGDHSVPFAMESLSKVFTLALALQDAGWPTVRETIGTYATGLPFNSIISPEVRAVHQQNPYVNMGAIATTGLIAGTDDAHKWQRQLAIFSDFAGTPLQVDREIFDSESASNQRNRALAWLYASYGLFDGDPMQAVARYTRACSVDVTAKDLALMGATIANGGVNPRSGKRVLPAEHVRILLGTMAVAGTYDAAGEWLVATGLPVKSGVGGGILAVVPGRFAIAVYSPPLDSFGNSVRGRKVVEALSSRWRLGLFDATH